MAKRLVENGVGVSGIADRCGAEDVCGKEGRICGKKILKVNLGRLVFSEFRMTRRHYGRRMESSGADQGMGSQRTNPGMGHADSLGKTVRIEAMAGNNIDEALIYGVLYSLSIIQQGVGGRPKKKI